MEEHSKRVKSIASRIEYYYRRGQSYRIYHGSTNSTRETKRDRHAMIDTKGMDHVLNIDTEKRVALVEPNVSMMQLVDATIAHGFIPPVVMEFPAITVGGGFAGSAGESSSFRYGFFDRIVNWVEFVLATGEVVKTSAQEKADLFYGAAGSCGTLGTATLFEIQLIEAKPYVQVTYHPVSSVSEALRTMNAAAKADANDFVDGILYAADHGVIVTGSLSDGMDGLQVQRFSRAQDPWFYIHAERICNRSSAPTRELVPIKDYLFRYDRGAFWTGKYAFDYFVTPFNSITRWALDYFMHTQVMYQALHASGHGSKYIIQDLLLPPEGAEEFIEWVNAEIDLTPLWLCPFRQSEGSPMRPVIGGEFNDFQDSCCIMNVGIWGPGPADHSAFVRVNRQLEEKVKALGGIKWLYARTYYAEDEFWSIYDKEQYNNLREKYQATQVPSVFEKVKIDWTTIRRQPKTWSEAFWSHLWNVWPVSGAYGVLKTLYDREYLLTK